MKPWNSFSAQVAILVAGVVFALGVLTLSFGIGYLILDDYSQRRELPPEIQAELATLDIRAVFGALSPEEARRYDAIGDEYYVDPPLVAIAAAFAAPLVLMAVAGAGAAALLTHRLAAPVTVVARLARRLAGGDLSARAGALAPKSHVAEVAQLVNDFDTLAAKLEAADAALARDAAAIAHELGTPLMVIRGTAQALLDEVYPPDRHAIARIVRHADQLSRIIEDLRVLSLASAGRLPLTREVVDLAEVAREAEPDLASRAAEAGVEIVIESGSAPAIADPFRVRQALTALVENAVRYAAEGKELRIVTTTQSDFAECRVLDRGPGPPDLREGSIFDAFVRGESSRSRETGGSGLGLAVVRAIAEVHGGSIAVEAREGGGSVFILQLPAAPDGP